MNESRHEQRREDRLAEALEAIGRELHEMNHQNSNHVLDRLNKLNFRLSRIARFLAALDAQT